MSTKECVKCKKSITLKKECEEEGVIYHAPCFRCYICDRFLSEYDVKIREGKLFCRYHGTLMGGLQPFCKVYFNDFRTCYRVIYAGEEPKDEEEESKNHSEEGEQDSESEDSASGGRRKKRKGLHWPKKFR